MFSRSSNNQYKYYTKKSIDVVYFQSTFHSSIYICTEWCIYETKSCPEYVWCLAIYTAARPRISLFFLYTQGTHSNPGTVAHRDLPIVPDQSGQIFAHLLLRFHHRARSSVALRVKREPTQTFSAFFFFVLYHFNLVVCLPNAFKSKEFIACTARPYVFAF